MTDRDPARETIDDDTDILWDAVRFLSEEGLIGQGPKERELAEGDIEAHGHAVPLP